MGATDRTQLRHTPAPGVNPPRRAIDNPPATGYCIGVMIAANQVAGCTAPRVSVVVAAYQQPALLNEALASVAAQHFESLEVLVVDDGSGAAFTRQYRLPPGAQLLTHPIRRGIAAATRNTGLRAARGEYVTFLDQDDLYLPQKIAAQVALLDAHPDAGLAFTHYQRVHADATPLARQDKPRHARGDVLRRMVRRNLIHCPSQVMIRRSLLARLGGFDETIRGAADWDMWLRCAAETKMVSDPQPLVRYRHHDGQWSRQSLMMLRGSVAVLEKAAAWLQRLDLAGLVRRRRARWLRELVRAQMAAGESPQDISASLRRAMEAAPWSPANYLLAACVYCAVPTRASAPQPTRASAPQRGDV